MIDKHRQLFEFVIAQHGNQKRKYTGEPYWVHLRNVADMMLKYMPKTLGFEIGSCHDLFEDTSCTVAQLHATLKRLGYASFEIDTIIEGTHLLTDYYTKERFAHLNREKRKALEATRLHTIPPLYQSVKYADLIDNTASIVTYDPEFARIYFSEARAILTYMNRGNPFLYELCEQVLHEAEVKLILSPRPAPS